MKLKRGTWGRIYRCGGMEHFPLACGAVRWPLEPATFVCPDCGDVGSYVPLVARPIYESRWWTGKRIAGYEVKGGGFIRIVRASNDELDRTREILS